MADGVPVGATASRCNHKGWPSTYGKAGL